MSLKHSASLVAAAAVVASLAVAAPSHAESVKVRDSRQDVSRIDFSECRGSGECPEMSNARHRPADVRRFSATLRPGSLRLVLRVAALSRKPVQRTIAGWEVRTPGSQTWQVLIDRRQEKVRFQLNQAGEKDACPEASFAVRPGSKVYSATIPVSCLGNPRWVRVGGGVVVLKGANFFFDDALDPEPSEGKKLVLTDRLLAGS